MLIKFTFFEKATKIDKIFTFNLTVCSNHQIDGEDFVNFFGLLRKDELYEPPKKSTSTHTQLHEISKTSPNKNRLEKKVGHLLHS